MAFDLVVVVIEYRARVSSNETFALTVLDTALKHIAPDNIAVIMNKCSEDDEPSEILAFYNEARTQAKAENLPVLKDCA